MSLNRFRIFPVCTLGVLFAGIGFAAGAGAPAIETIEQAAANKVTQEDLDRLDTLRPGHPRIYLTPERIERLKVAIQDDKFAREMFEQLRAEADRILPEPVSEYKLIGPRLLSVSRRALDRIKTLGLVYRLGGQRRHADRAIQEMMAVLDFPDWHPSHFLDTAEMSNAVGIGYDWLYDELSAEQREAARDGILQFGLGAAVPFFEGKKRWVANKYNWNQVCNGGLAAGALAIADEAPRAAAYILARTLESIPLALASFDPDGGWAEGPGYWNYATRYTAYYFLALDSALGTDFGLSDRPGLSRAAWFRVHSIGPLGKTFNYADAKPPSGSAWQNFWFAARYGEPYFTDYELRAIGGRPDPMHLLLYPEAPSIPAPPPPLDAYFESVQAAFLRSDWDDPDAIYLGFKGGDNKAGHSHLDLGTFVLDALGHRWAEELGGDDYNLPSYFGKLRWTYYRLRTEGQNTLLINGANQDSEAEAPIVAYRSTPGRALAVADLSQGYREHARSVRRGVALLDRARIVMVDEVAPNGEKPAQIEWAMHTEARVKTDGATATLTQGEASLRATILTPRGATFSVHKPVIPEPQKQAPSLSKLTVTLEAKTKPARLAILFEPYQGQTPPGAAAMPDTSLDNWIQWAE